MYRAFKEWNYSQLLAAVIAGLVIGLITASAQISFAVLIFSGEMAPFVAQGIGLFLMGSLVATLITGFTSSYPGMISPNEDVPAAIVAVMAAGIAATLASSVSPNDKYITVVVAIALSSLLTGFVFIIQGYFKLGALFRFLPYPVVGGFLAGLGWVLTSGGLTAMANVPLQVGQLDAFIQFNVLIQWLPGALFAVVMLLLLSRFNHYLLMPGLIFGAAALFYFVVFLIGVPLEQVSEKGWFLGPFSEGGLWRPFDIAAFSTVQWSAIATQSGNIAALVIVSTIALLLSASGMELTVEQDIQLDKELQASGLGTLGSGLVGGMVSYPALGLSTLGYRIGGSSRLIGTVVAAVLGAVVFFGPSVLSWTPKLVFGGLLMFLGLSLLDEWVYRAWFKFSRIDYLIILAILVVVAGFGFLQGVTLGVGLAIILFVVNYSRVNVIKHTLSGADYHSRVTRRRRHRNVLEQQEHKIYILQLQGYIFFGTANNILNRVRQRLEAVDLPTIRFVIFDFQQVSGVDSTAVLSFTKLIKLAQKQNVTLIFTNPTLDHALPHQDSAVAKLFAQLHDVESVDAQQTVRIFSELDRGLEWCENQLLLAAGEDISDTTVSLSNQLSAFLPYAVEMDRLLTYFVRLDVAAGQYLIRQGEPSDDLYFIESGQVTAQLEYPDRSPVRLETMGGGTVVGEIGFYLEKPRTAAVVADEPSTVYCLSQQTMERMIRDDPEMAFAFHQGMIRLASMRITQLIATVNALQR